MVVDDRQIVGPVTPMLKEVFRDFLVPGESTFLSVLEQNPSSYHHWSEET